MTDKRIGNKFAVGLTTNGAPPIYEKPDELCNKINEYFDSLLATDDEGEVSFKERPTITGMALFLGFSSRQSIYDYAEKKDFSYIIKRAQLVVESSYEEMLLSKASTGAIFALKNMGWKDKVENTNTNINFEAIVTKEEAKTISNDLESEC